MLQEQPRTAGGLKILAWTTACWDNAVDARARLQNNREDSRNDDPMLGISAWKDRMHYLFHPVGFFLASGTYSDPRFLWVLGVSVVNAGAPNTGPYEGYYRHYGKCAWTAAMAFALNRNDWDILACLDTDALVGNCDLNSIVREFWNRPEILCCPGWGGPPGGPLILQKREAASRLLHNREIGNLRDPDQTPAAHLWEAELMHIFRPTPEGVPRWWNPWSQFHSFIYDPQDWFNTAPMVSKFGPSTEFAKRYEQTQVPLAIPYHRDPVKC